jgi:hypothetical protein
VTLKEENQLLRDLLYRMREEAEELNRNADPKRSV